MSKKDASASLKEAISLLEIRQAEEGRLLKEQLYVTFERLKPVNLIKSAFNEITSSIEIKNSLVNSLISGLTGYLTKRVIVGPTHNIFKKLAGILLQYGVTVVVSRYSETLRNLGLQLIQYLHNKMLDENMEPVAGNVKLINHNLD